MMKLKKLVKDIPGCQVKGSKEVAITGVSANSKLIAPGNLFIARKGKTHDGGHYIQEAIQAGACAVVTDLFDPSLKHITQVIHPHVQAIEADLAATYYQFPSQELLLVGLTGTNGKTTTSFIVKNLLERFMGSCGLIGTIEYIVGAQRYRATHTTPDVVTNHKLLREMCLQGCQAAVMEVTSHALDQGRVANIDFDVALFTNLTIDHLDYHKSMEHYCQAKNRLFRQMGQIPGSKKRAKWAVVNQDSEWTPAIVQGCQVPVLSYGMQQPADLFVTHLEFEQQATRAKVTYQGETVDCYWPFIGRFNAYNCLAALAVALTQGVSLEKIAYEMANLPPVRGRLEPVKNELGLKIYVDFAHSGDALKNVLQTLQEVKKQGRLIVVFGAGGDRDPNRRSLMAKACEQYADVCVITSDNPRSEDPYQICTEIAQNFTTSACYQLEVDRRLAIQKALEMADPNDIVLIAGKGHETYQIFAHQTVEFDDCQIAADLCAQLCIKPA